MATNHSQQLSNNQIVRLAAAISADKMESIAEGYMNIAPEKVKNIWMENQGKAEAFNRAIIRHWANKNPADEVKSLAALLCKAAAECIYPDLRKVQQILGVTSQESSVGISLTVMHEELLSLAEDLRPHMTKCMKMEPAPWIKDYVVDMEELYTELELQKINHRLYCEEHVKLENYRELFVTLKPGALEYLDIRYYCPKLNPQRKILFKGDPGMGKTSLVKKIAWDWANGNFVNVSIVFFVFLKFVKPGDIIENVILQQNPPLEGKHLTKNKLTEILDYLGNECLLILDGLDEFSHDYNEDVLKIVMGSKFLKCNILLTSRPHSTLKFETYFDTIVSVEGFTRSEAGKFASRIVPDGKKVEDILNFNPSGEKSDRSVHNVPILVSFLCLLVREDNIDLSNERISIGEIYFRMVQCLYKKFTIRKGIDFEVRSLVTVLMSLGKLALQTLLSGNPLLKRSQIIRQVGTYVFDYWLLFGHEDYRLIRDVTADIFVTFPHRSLLEFLGAFYFVLSLGKGQTINDVNKVVQEFLKNSLFAEFCLWFLDEAKRIFPFPERYVAFEMLSSYVAEQIDDVKVYRVELEKKYPAFGLALIDEKEMGLKFLEKTLAKCFKIEQLGVAYDDPNNHILRSLQPVVYKRLKSITVHGVSDTHPRFAPEKSPESPLLFLHSYHNWGSNIEVKCKQLDFESSWGTLDIVLNVAEYWKRPVLAGSRSAHGPSLSLLTYPRCVNLFLKSCDLNSDGLLCLAQGRLTTLYTLDISGNPDVGGKLDRLLCSHFPALDTLLMRNCGLKPCDMSSVGEASVNGRLPKLSALDVSNNLLGGHLSMLFCERFPSLESLALNSCDLKEPDVFSLAQAMKQALLPQLTSVDVSFVFFPYKGHSFHIISTLLNLGVPRSNTIVVRGCWLEDKHPYELKRQAVGNGGVFRRLQAIDMSQNPNISGHLSLFMCHNFPNLYILVLRKCELTSEDMSSLAQASSEGRLRELRHLDLSQNVIGNKTKGLLRLLTEVKHFPSLLNILLCDCQLQLQDLDCLRQVKLNGKLPRIRHLDISLNGLSGDDGILSRDPITLLSRDPITQREISWGKVKCYDHPNYRGPCDTRDIEY